jgi:hypothetical protein
MSVEIMFNASYGGFSFSKAAMEEYQKRCPEKDWIEDWKMDRHDPVMVRIVKEMGNRANGSFSNIQLQKIQSDFLHHYKISEYDGLENVVIDYNAYRIDTAKAILRDTNLTKSDKLARVSAVLNSELKNKT